MHYRHEWKHEINAFDRMELVPRLDAVMQRDSHAVNGTYTIRSLYLDTPDDTALREKQDGVNIREKFRIRYYNDDLTYIVLEKKSKINGLTAKETVPLSQNEVLKIVQNDIAFLKTSEYALCQELYIKMQTLGLRPKTIVEYTRIPYVFAAGNVRVTIDYDIRTGLNNKDFLSPQTLTIKAGDAPILLEVKWDAFLPDIIKAAVSVPNRRTVSFSKYEQCRIYG